MAKRVPQRKRQQKKREVNWVMLGGIMAVGAVALFALLFATLQGQGVPTPTPDAITVLHDFCDANDENCMEKGSDDAPVTIIEVSDYACVHCRNFNVEGTSDAIESQFVDSGEVRWIVVPYSTNDATLPAAEASFCAADQDAFFEFHRAMFDLFGQEDAYTRAGILSAADAVGVDIASFEACMDSGENANNLQRNLAVVRSAGVRVTPSFFINGQLVEGNLPLSNFEQLIGEAAGS